MCGGWGGGCRRVGITVLVSKGFCLTEKSFQNVLVCLFYFFGGYILMLPFLFSVFFLTILSKSFRVSKAGNVRSVEGHCTAFRLELHCQF